MRVGQGAGERGSLKWIQRAINQRSPRTIDNLILPRLGNAASITWCSPLANDDCAEYRDAAFLKAVGAAQFTTALEMFWPPRGPQWDALGRSDRGDILLVEAKAHVGELCSPGSQASPVSRKKIEASLEEVSSHLGARPRAPRARRLALLAGDRLARLAVAPIPVPRRCNPDPAPARRLPRRKAFRYRRNHPAAKVRTQAASHPHLPAITGK